jgi:hypothetical protein
MQAPAPIDILERKRQEAAEQAARNEQAHKANVQLFEGLFLGLGSDCMKLDGTRHDAELMEARGRASARWHQLLQMEQQVERDTAALGARPKKRPGQRDDELLPDRTLEARNRAWEEETKSRHLGLAELRKLASTERSELQSFITTRR